MELVLPKGADPTPVLKEKKLRMISTLRTETQKGQAVKVYEVEPIEEPKVAKEEPKVAKEEPKTGLLGSKPLFKV